MIAKDRKGMKIKNQSIAAPDASFDWRRESYRVLSQQSCWAEGSAVQFK